MKKQEICAVFLGIFIVEVLCSSGHPNVLLLIVDDLRPALGCYGDDLALTPNIDALAQEGTVFTRAYAQQALCGPSRTSFLTSRRPDTTKLYDVHSYWRKHAGNFTTLPQYFKDHGYHTVSAGKIFHPGIVSNHSDDQPYSWSEEPYHPPTQAHKMDPVCLGDDGSLHTSIYCPVQVEDQPGGSLPDIETTSFAVRWLQRRAAQNRKLWKHHNNNNISADPFFLAVGYHKPHIPLKFPAQFLDLYPISSVPLAPNPHLPSGLPPVAWNPWNDLRWRADIKALNISFPYGPMPDDYARYIRQGYYAATTYTDSLIGDVLETINTHFPDTIIAFIGDHGWSLGEHQEWSKFSNFEVATRVPFIISRWRHRNIPFKGFSSLFPRITNPKKRTVKSQRKEKLKSKILFESRNQLLDAPVEIMRKSGDRSERKRYLTPKSYFSWNKWLPSPDGFTQSKLPDISMKIRDKTEKQRKSTPRSDFDRIKWKVRTGTTRTVSHSGLVELIDLFPTLVDLAGLYALPTCPHDSRLVNTCTEGSSMSPLLNLLWSDIVPQAFADQEGMQNSKQKTFNSDILSDRKATRNSKHRYFNHDGLSKDIVNKKTIQSSKQFSFIENAVIDLAATVNDKQYLDIEDTSISSQLTRASKEHLTMKTARVYSKLLSEVEKATHDIYQQSSIKIANMDSNLVSGISVKLAAFSQYPRPGLTPSVHPDSDQPATRDTTVMGYSMRTGRFRYTVWLPFNSSSLVPNWSRILAQELYDHHIDPQEDHNVVGNADYVPVTHSLHARLVKGWRHSVSAL